MDEWRGFRRRSFPGETWTVDGGCLKRRASGEEQDLASKREFGDFELEFEWNISPGGNSGVKYLVREDRPASWDRAAYEYTRQGLIRRGMTNSEEFKTLSLEKYRRAPIGFEFQILDDEKNSDARNGRNRITGALYDLLAPSQAANAPAGVFNRGRIVLSAGHVQHWVNDVKLLEFDLDGAELREQIARSKFAAMPGFGSARRGHIVLQDHGSAVRFRNIRVRDLTPPAPAREPDWQP